MADLLTSIRAELDERLAALRPSVQEYERLMRAADALAAVAPAPARAASVPPPPRPDGSAAAPTRRKRAAKRAVRARPGQTQQRVIDTLREAPGSTSTAVAKAVGISTNAAAATISRLVKQGRLARRSEGGYIAVEAEPARVEAVTPDPAAAAPEDVSVEPTPPPPPPVVEEPAPAIEPPEEPPPPAVVVDEPVAAADLPAAVADEPPPVSEAPPAAPAEPDPPAAQ